MSRKHIDVDAPVPEPVTIRTLLTGQLTIRFNGAKPTVRLIETNRGFEVVYQVRDEIFGRYFETRDKAEGYFSYMTGRSGDTDYLSRRVMIQRRA